MSESKRQSIKILNPSVSLSEGDIVMRGVICPDSISLLKVGPYQREILSGRSVHSLMLASIEGVLPDIDLGVRGEKYTTKKDAIYIHDETYIVDGLQRTNGAKLAIDAGKKPIIGVCIRLNTTEETEKKRFEKLNATQRKLSANVLLRNFKSSNDGIKLLYNLSHDSSFKMCDRVTWNQNMKASQLMTSRTFVSLAIKINYRVGNNLGKGKYDKLANAIESIVESAGQRKVKHNVKHFFEVVNSVWNIDGIHYKKGAAFMRLPFLSALAMLFARHKRFWKDGKLFVDQPTKRKLKTFALNDPMVDNLTKTGETGSQMVYQLLVDHVNSGKSTHRLVADIGLL